MADGKTFDAFNPDKSITDPKSLGANKAFPAHVFKWAGYLTDEEGTLITEGRDERPIVAPNDYITVHNEDELAAALRKGWSATPVHTEPVAVESTGESEPEKRKPGRPKSA